MRRRTISLSVIALAVIATSTAMAAEVKVGERENGLSSLDERYIAKWDLCWQKFKQDCGANLLASAWSDAEPVSEDRIAESLARIERWLNPPEPEPVESAEYASTDNASEYAPAATSSGGCVGMSAESGSAGYAAMSPSGYVGCYQIAPFHYSQGVCTGMGTDPAGQDACAAAICASQGAGAWTNSAGQNPC